MKRQPPEVVNDCSYSSAWAYSGARQDQNDERWKARLLNVCVRISIADDDAYQEIHNNRLLNDHPNGSNERGNVILCPLPESNRPPP